MALLESCCCWRSVRRGSYASAIYTMVYFSLTTLVVGCYLYEEQVVMTATNSTRSGGSGGTTVSLLQPDAASEAAVAFSVVVLVCSTCGLLSTVLLLVGLRLDNRMLLLPWMVVVTVTGVVDVTHITHVLITEANFKPEVAMLFTVDFFLLSLNVYSLLCVVSQYQEYKAGRGRAVDDDNLLRFAPVRYLAQPTATSGLSTRRGTHTTVHDAHSPSGDARDANGANGALDAAPFSANGGHGVDNGGTAVRLVVPPPPYSRRPPGSGSSGIPTTQGSTRKHVQFPDMSNARVVLDEDSSQGDSPGTGVEDGSAGLEWPIPQDEKALLSYH
ncbi:uncharacterized protein LOC117653234 [Thrips palmi]|uniref:Uncharacterized protein LOC117653234 n=1 Tax=Thrips palmi TaxID=161013 RepID=A0A6P9AB89_THRPL|nr:uncharacterized protein LOC117653234 [Thrips palmi]